MAALRSSGLKADGGVPWNDSDVPRAVLIFDIWNPNVRPAEREMVAALTAGVGDFYGELPPFM